MRNHAPWPPCHPTAAQPAGLRALVQGPGDAAVQLLQVAVGGLRHVPHDGVHLRAPDARGVGTCLWAGAGRVARGLTCQGWSTDTQDRMPGENPDPRRMPSAADAHPAACKQLRPGHACMPPPRPAIPPPPPHQLGLVVFVLARLDVLGGHSPAEGHARTPGCGAKGLGSGMHMRARRGWQRQAGGLPRPSLLCTHRLDRSMYPLSLSTRSTMTGSCRPTCKGGHGRGAEVRQPGAPGAHQRGPLANAGPCGGRAGAP